MSESLARRLVADLLWTVESPSFVEGTDTVAPGHLDAADVDAEHLVDALGPLPRRVGHHFERLVRYWLEEYRFDGFRFDGVTSMLYHSRGAKSFGSYDDYFGADADPDAILYLQLATTLARETKPGVILVAEDMSGMPDMSSATKMTPGLVSRARVVASWR